MRNFFTTDYRKGRWWFMTPDGKPFWSIGMHHVDATAIRFSDSGGVWERDEDNSSNAGWNLLRRICTTGVLTLSGGRRRWSSLPTVFTATPVPSPIPPEPSDPGRPLGSESHAAGFVRTPDDVGWPPAQDRIHDTEHYHAVVEALWNIPQCVGYHLCGAYLRNNAQCYGFRDRRNILIPETVNGINTVNARMLERISGDGEPV